jgi:hypothetical protein
MLRLMSGCITALVLAGQASVQAETMAELYEKAKVEKELVFYSGGPAAPHENRAKLFMQQFPGIDVKVTGGFSNVLNEIIEKQMAEKKLQVDMTFFQTVQDYVKWKAQGKLMNFKADGFDQVYRNLRDDDGAYIAFSANALTYAYNTAKVRSEDVPQSALDFLKPIFSGNVITCYPADDDATLYLMYLIVQKNGWSWMDKYMANKPNFVQGHLPVARSVADGENAGDIRCILVGMGVPTPGQTQGGGQMRTQHQCLPRAEASSGCAAPERGASTSAGISPRSSRAGSALSRCAQMYRPRRIQPLTSYKIANNYRSS